MINNNKNTIDIYENWEAIHKGMRTRYKIDKADVDFANNLSQSIKKIYDEISNIQPEEEGIYKTLKENVLSYYINAGNYKGFNYVSSALTLGNDKNGNQYKGIDNEFELEMAALIDTALTGNYNKDNFHPDQIISAQHSFITYTPGKNLNILLNEIQKYVKNRSSSTMSMICSEFINSWLTNAKAKDKIAVKKTGQISGGKTDISILPDTINMNIVLPNGLAKLRETLESYKGKNATFSLKSYNKNTIHFGNSNLFNSLYLPLRALNIVPRRRIRTFLFLTLKQLKNDDYPIIEHINHIRSIYDITGLGQYTKNNISLEAKFLIVSISKQNFSVIPMSVLANAILDESNKNSIVFSTEKTITDYINDEEGKEIKIDSIKNQI